MYVRTGPCERQQLGLVRDLVAALAVGLARVGDVILAEDEGD